MLRVFLLTQEFAGTGFHYADPLGVSLFLTMGLRVARSNQ